MVRCAVRMWLFLFLFIVLKYSMRLLFVSGCMFVFVWGLG